MDHLIAYTGNDPELLACALLQARLALYWRTPGPPEGWGVGFVQGEEVLLQKRPRPESAEVDFYAITKDLRADALIGRVGLADGGLGAAENSDPFRFRSWLFGLIGEIESFDLIRERLLSSIPEFLRRNIRGRSPSEHVFHLFLAFLHDGGLLEVRAPETNVVHHALHQSLVFFDKLLAGVGAPSSRLGLVVTNGRCMVAEARGVPIQHLDIEGIADCGNPSCPAHRGIADDQRRITHSELTAIVVEADRKLSPRQGWRPLPDNHSLLVDLHRKTEIVANPG